MMHMKIKGLICLFALLGVFVVFSNSCTKDDKKKDTDIDTNVVTDIDSNEYHTVNIGDQIWMVENLRVTHYRNGDLIGTTNPATKSIRDESEPEYQWAYNGDDAMKDLSYHGRLYTWYAIKDTRNVCPSGWHIPGDSEWKKLEMYLGMSQDDAGGTDYRGTNEGSQIAGEMNLWPIYCTIVNDANFDITGFVAVPAGYRYPDGTFDHFTNHAFWWTSTESDAYNARWLLNKAKPITDNRIYNRLLRFAS
jgi:uncharacterized protein (TIGR02145 family)